jgi:hypothetical protein
MSDSVYRERARLVAHLAAIYPSAIIPGADPSEPDWPLVFVHTTEGQLSWHVSPEDVDLFEHVRAMTPEGAFGHFRWDGHTTEEKYERLARLTEIKAKP